MSPKQTVEAIFASFSRGDIAGILSRVAPNATWKQSPLLPWGGEFVGPEGAGQFFSKLNDVAETLDFQVHLVIESGADAAAFGVWEGKSRKTGKTVRDPWAYQWRVENGKVTYYEGFHDTAAVLKAFA